MPRPLCRGMARSFARRQGADTPRHFGCPAAESLSGVAHPYHQVASRRTRLNGVKMTRGCKLVQFDICSLSASANLFRHVTIILSLLGITSCGARTSNVRAEPSGAVDSSVVFPLPIPSTGQLRWPTAARFDDGWVIAANVFPSGLNTPIGHRALYLAHSRRGLLPLPEGDLLFAYPLVHVTPDGALHLFWSEGPASATPHGWPYTLTSVWHATFASGRWTTPERVIGGTWLGWDSRAPQIATDDSGRVHLVVAAADSGRPEEIYHVMRDAAGWHRQGMGEHGGYPALASLPGGGLAMVLVMDDRNGRSSGLYARLSADYGKTWSQPERVLPITDTSTVYKTQLRVVGDSLYLGWIGAQTEEGTIWSLSRRRVTREGPANAWTVPVRSEPLSGTLFSVTFAVNGCGSIRALAELLAPGMRAVVRELRVRDGRVVVEQPFGDTFTIAPLADRSGGRIIQLWNGLRAQQDSVQPFFREFSTCR